MKTPARSCLKTDKTNASKHLYKLALGYYNVTSYDYAWELVEYYRSGVDGYNILKTPPAFKKNIIALLRLTVTSKRRWRHQMTKRV